MKPQGRGATGLVLHLLAGMFILGTSQVVFAQEVSPASPANSGCPGQEACPSAGYTPWEVIKGSIFGVDNPAPWAPLYLSTLFREGWNEPWAVPPNGASGVPRQGWINTFDGFLARDFTFVYEFTDHRADGRDENLGVLQFHTPLSRRLWLGIDVPYVDGIQGAGGLPSVTNFGDITITPKVLLHETENFSLSAGLSIQTPTGQTATGSGQTDLFPFLALWTDLGNGWSIRGGTGVDVPLDRSAMPDTVYVANLAVGQTLSGHAAAPLGDFTYYLAVNLRQDLGPDNNTFVSLTPGIRTYLGHNFYLMSAIEIPVANPRPFDDRFILAIVKGF